MHLFTIAVVIWYSATLLHVTLTKRSTHTTDFYIIKCRVLLWYFTWTEFFAFHFKNEDQNEPRSTKEGKSITFDNSFCIVHVDKSFCLVFNTARWENWNVLNICSKYVCIPWIRVSMCKCVCVLAKRNTIYVFQCACIRCNNKYRKVFLVYLEGPCRRISIFGCCWTLSQSICIQHVYEYVWASEWVSGCEHVREYQSNFKVKIHTYTTHYGLTFELATKYAWICVYAYGLEKNTLAKYLFPNTNTDTHTKKL